MTYLPDLHSYLHHSSLLLQAYPTTRITTKYSLPRKPKSTSTSKRAEKSSPNATTTAALVTKEKREPAATLTLKTYHADTGICLKYRTNKAQEVGRLLAGLGRLARREIIELPSGATNAVAAGAGEDKMDVDVEATEVEGVLKDGKAPVAAGKSSAEMTQQQQQPPPPNEGGSGIGSKKKKKGKK